MLSTIAFIENDMYVRNFITSGAFDFLMRDDGFAFCVSEIVQKLKGSIPAERIIKTYERNKKNISLTYRFNKISTLALREKSSTLDIKAKKGWFGEYTHEDRLMASVKDYNLTRQYFLKCFENNHTIEAIIKEHRPGLVIFPVTGVESTGTELILLSQKYHFQTLFLVNGWDNLSSKGIFPVLPDYLGAWGPQSLVDAVEIQGMRPHRVFLLGSARYEDYFKSENLHTSPFSHQHILFAGATTPCDEITPLQIIEQAMEDLGIDDTQVVYRPHPWREKRNCFDVFEPEKYKHIILDPQIEHDYFNEKQRGTESVSSQNFPRLNYYPSLVKHALFAVSPMSSMSLEAALFDVPVIILANKDEYHPVPPDLQAAYKHFEGADEVPGWFFIHDLNALKERFKELFIRFKNESPANRQYKGILSNAMKKYLYFDNQSYAQRLFNATNEIHAGMLERGWRSDMMNAIQTNHRDIQSKRIDDEDILKEADRLSRIGDTNGALSAYGRIIQSTPEHVDVHYKMALLYYQIGQLNLAVEHFKKIAELEPGEVSVLNNLGVLCYETRQYLDAIDYLQRALGKSPNYPDAWHNLSRVYLALKQEENAARALTECLTRAPDHDLARETLGQLHPENIQPIIASMPRVSLPCKNQSSINLMNKDYSGHRIVRENGRMYIENGKGREHFRVHLVSARWTNHPWGYGNEAFRALIRMGFDVIDTDFRHDFDQLSELLQQEAHLTLVLKGDRIPPDLIRRIPGFSILWYPDDLLVTEHGPRDIAYNGHAFDRVYGFAKYDLAEYEKYGVQDIRWLPLSCDPYTHRKLNLPKSYDLSFVGNIYPNRRAMLDRLKKSFNIYITRAFGEKMVRIFNQSKIVLNLGIGSGGIQHRVFEALACGSMFLTNELPGEERIFQDRVHLVYYNEENLETLIQYYLDHEDEREAIAKQGHDEVLEKHTFEHRMDRIIQDIFQPEIP
ncbi:MAG: glycosyltransferase [Deltaproteobacteria bacterium]|nr:glycosyltransferase [Deltaproteobacteria bacterium]